MVDSEKLKKLFQAALADPSEETPKFTRVLPPSAPPVRQPEPEPTVPAPAPAIRPANTGLDAVSSAALKALLDEQHQRVSRKHRREGMLGAAVLLLLAGGGFAWFVQSPNRTQAFHEAIADIRSLSDVTAMAGKYRHALDKISTNSKQIDAATESMGVSSSLVGAKDIHLDAEMNSLTGGESQPGGTRQQRLEGKFGKASPHLPSQATAARD
ncbi:hypothetical protein HQ447_07200 [bacterium]|nr:hypothetical protein [bacterium]